MGDSQDGVQIRLVHLIAGLVACHPSLDHFSTD